MAAQEQATCYPSQAMQVRQPPSGKPDIHYKPFCTKCNAKDPHTSSSCCTSTGSSNGTTHYALCATYCNTSPNTVCAVYQAYCNIDHEYINSHKDVGEHPEIKCSAKDEFIFRNWTHTYWNSLIDKIDTAEIVGLTLAFSKGPEATPATGDPQNIPHPANSLVTAEKYNQIISKLNRFLFDYGHQEKVKGSAEVGCEKADVIRAAHALALINGYNNAKFTAGVCDICNANRQTNPTCDCNCDCPCSCSCGCDCPCDCFCSCTCGSS